MKDLAAPPPPPPPPPSPFPPQSQLPPETKDELCRTCGKHKGPHDSRYNHPKPGARLAKAVRPPPPTRPQHLPPPPPPPPQLSQLPLETKNETCRTCGKHKGPHDHRYDNRKQSKSHQAQQSQQSRDFKLAMSAAQIALAMNSAVSTTSGPINRVASAAAVQGSSQGYGTGAPRAQDSSRRRSRSPLRGNESRNTDRRRRRRRSESPRARDRDSERR